MKILLKENRLEMPLPNGAQILNKDGKYLKPYGRSYDSDKKDTPWENSPWFVLEAST